MSAPEEWGADSVPLRGGEEKGSQAEESGATRPGAGVRRLAAVALGLLPCALIGVFALGGSGGGGEAGAGKPAVRMEIERPTELGDPTGPRPRPATNNVEVGAARALPALPKPEPSSAAVVPEAVTPPLPAEPEASLQEPPPAPPPPTSPAREFGL